VFTQLYAPPSQAVEDLHAATAIYTATHIIDTLLDRLDWPRRPGRLLDPSAGDGAFLLQALKQLDLTNPDNLDRIQGWEIHPGAAAEARAKISAHLIHTGYDPTTARRAANKIVINKDFLTDGPRTTKAFQVIAGNPPYLRYQRLPQYFRDLYENYLPAYARGDLLHSFLDSCSRLIDSNGIIGLVCSDRFLFNCTAGQLRRELGTRIGISHLARLDQATAFYRPKHRVKDSPPRIHPVEIIFQPSATANFKITEAPISPDNLNAKPFTGRTLSDIAKISIAPWLGPFGIFVIDQTIADALRDYADIIPAVDTDDIDSASETLRAPTKFVLRTYRDLKPHPRLARHLREQLERMPPRGRRTRYWLPPESLNLEIGKPSLLIPRIARKLKPIDLPAGVLPLNHNMTIVNNNQVPLSTIKGILTSEKSHHWITKNAPRLENGYFSITTKLLRRLPI